MGRSHTIIRAVTTNLTRSSTVATLDALAVSILALFKAGGTYDLGMDRCWVQWDGTDLDVVLEDDGLAAVASDISARNATIETGLESLTPTISAVNTANIETFEQSALAVTDDVIIGVDYAADSWPEDHFADPQSLPTGWEVDTTGGAPDTAASYVAVGSGYAMQLDSDADGKAQVSKTFSGLTTATTWELRAEVKVANPGTTSDNYCITIHDGTKNLTLKPDTTGLRYFNGSSTTGATLGHAMASGDWVVYWVRREGDVVSMGIGPYLLHLMAYSAITGSTAVPGVVTLGNNTTGAKTATIRRFSLRLGSVNEAPPGYTMRGTTHGR